MRYSNLILAVAFGVLLTACGKQDPVAPVPPPQPQQPYGQQPYGQQPYGQPYGQQPYQNPQQPWPAYQAGAQWSGPNGYGYAQWQGGMYNNAPVYYYPQNGAYYYYQPQRQGYVQWTGPYGGGTVAWTR